MPAQLITDSRDRFGFIGGSDARTIMGSDEAALVRLWREKRGEAHPKTCPMSLWSNSAQ